MSTVAGRELAGQVKQPGTRGLIGAAGSVSAATMISRVLGVVREMIMARYFGAGLYTDAFYVAYRIPNLLRDLFAEGALSSAFVPTFIRSMTEEGRPRAWELANHLIHALAVVLGVITLLFYFGARWFVWLLAAGFAQNPEKFELTVRMTRIMSPFLLFVALAAVFMGMLNASGKFFLPAMAPSAFNVCVILAGVFLSPFMPRFGLDPIVAMAIGAIVGGASQFLVQVPSARGVGFRYRFGLDIFDPGLRRIGRLMLPAIVGLSATQINITVDNQLASRFGNGPVSYLNYAFRLMQLPIGIFGVAIATATLTAVSIHAAHNAIGKLRTTVAGSLRLAACLTFPATVGLILFRVEIVRLLYQRGSFLPADTLETSRVLLLYALALFAYASVKILVPTFYALDDTRTPVRASIITVAAKIAVNFALIVPMGFLGLAAATAFASWLNFGLLLKNLGARTGGKWSWTELGVYLRIALASAGMGLLAHTGFVLSEHLIPLAGSWGLLLDMTVAIGIGMFSILPLLRLFGVQDGRELSGMLFRLLKRPA